MLKRMVNLRIIRHQRKTKGKIRSISLDDTNEKLIEGANQDLKNGIGVSQEDYPYQENHTTA